MNPIIAEEYIVLLAFGVLSATLAVSWVTSARISMGWRVAITLFRTLAVAGILVLFLNPGVEHRRFEKQDSSWAVMVDQSQSMGYADVDAKRRWDASLNAIDTVFTLTRKPEALRVYTFSDTANEVTHDDLKTMKPEGTDTRIVESGQSLLIREKSRGSNLKGILLFSDGRQPTQVKPEPFALRAAAQGVPIFPMVMGGDVPSKDLSVSISRHKLVSFKGQPVSIRGNLVNHRMGPVSAAISLKDAEGNIIETAQIFAGDGQETEFRFSVSSDIPGYYEYSLETPWREGESDRANNTVHLGVFVLSERLNVLLLEGEPYWDTKFLSHLLRAQSNISMTAIFRVAKDKFFRVATHEAMTSSNTDVFPKSADELARYDLVVLGKGTEYFMDETRTRLLKEFVKDHGGCVFFARGKSYGGSFPLIEDLEPVVWGDAMDSDFVIRPRLAGEQVGLFGGLLPGKNDPLWTELPSLSQGHTCDQLKSFTSVLAQGIPIKSHADPFPLLVSKRYGSGLVLLINGDGLWKWGFSSDASDDGLYRNLWIQLFQWAVSFSEFNPGSDYLIRSDQSRPHVGEPLRIRVRARAHIKPRDIAIRVYRDGMGLQTLALDRGAMINGEWSGLIILPQPGVYTLVTETPEGDSLGARLTLRALPPPGEADNESADPDFLRTLAQASGGTLITLEGLPEIVKTLDANKQTLGQGDLVWETWWDKAIVCILIMLLFGCEWFIRRRQGLH